MSLPCPPSAAELSLFLEKIQTLSPPRLGSRKQDSAGPFTSAGADLRRPGKRVSSPGGSGLHTLRAPVLLEVRLGIWPDWSWEGWQAGNSLMSSLSPGPRWTQGLQVAPGRPRQLSASSRECVGSQHPQAAACPCFINLWGAPAFMCSGASVCVWEDPAPAFPLLLLWGGGRQGKGGQPKSEILLSI